MGRFITVFERGQYLSDTPMYSDMSGAFKHIVAESGWLAKPLNEFSLEDGSGYRKDTKRYLIKKK